MQALKPSIADCCRTVFAAFLWHERLVKDAMVCSTYLKFHPELHSVSSFLLQKRKMFSYNS